MKKVLVLLATYNGEKYLCEQLDSVFAQKNVEMHVLARDDGSFDQTKAILQEYSDHHFLKWYTGKHLNVQKGYFNLMQKAVETDFDYFAFCDQDDIWDADKIETALQQMGSVNVPTLYYCGQRLVDADAAFIADHRLNQDRSLQARFVLSDFAGCTGVFNRSLLEEVVKFEPAYMLMHDTWILKVCLCLGGKVVVDPEPHMNYRQHCGNTVGLGRSLPAYVKQVRQYLNEYHVEKQMKELKRGYGDRMVAPYKEICDWVCHYKDNRKYKKYLLDKKNIDFCNKGLNLTYWLKVQLNKL